MQGLLVVPADHGRQRGDARGVARRDARPVAAAHRSWRWSPSRVAAGRGPAPAHQVFPATLGRAAARRRGRRRRRRSRHRRAGGEGLRPGGPRARPTSPTPPSDLYRSRVRDGPAAGALHARPAGHPGARPGRRSSPSAAGWPSTATSRSARSSPSPPTWCSSSRRCACSPALLAVGQQARAGAERILDLLDSNPLVAEKPDAARRCRAGRAARSCFDDVRFGYLRSEPVLDGFSLRVAPGETRRARRARRVRASRRSPCCSRASTTCRRARSRIDGIDVRDVTLDSLRRQVGVVFEESFLFSDTVRANIAYGRPDATDAEVEAAAAGRRGPRLHHRAARRLRHRVGERGLTLSGGQRQRVALARALLTDPRS